MSDFVRPASPPVFDSRTDELPYLLTTWVNGDVTDWRRPMPDPFHNTSIVTHYGWRDRLRILFGRTGIEVRVAVHARPDVQEAVLELNDNYRGVPGSDRRRQADEVVRRIWTT